MSLLCMHSRSILLFHVCVVIELTSDPIVCSAELTQVGPSFLALFIYPYMLCLADLPKGIFVSFKIYSCILCPLAIDELHDTTA